MRPVSITQITQQEYDESGELNRNKHIKGLPQKPQKGQKAKPTTTTTMMVQAVIQDLQSLVDRWLSAGAQTQKQGRATVKKWDNQTDEAKYKLLKSAKIEGYGNSRRALITRLGQICSYCETPVFSHMHVEHMMPKNSFPSKALSWSNFLISCPTCNTIKGDTPNQQTPAGLKPTADALTYNANNYFWPQNYWTSFQDGTPFPFKYELKRLAFIRSKWQFKETIQASDYKDLVAQYQNGTIYVRDGKMAVPTTSRGYNYIGLELSWNTALSQNNQGVIRSTLGLTDQNKLLNAVNAQKSIDRRMELRTVAFFKANIVAARLNAVAGNQALYEAVLRQAQATIAASGFWGVWFYFFRQSGFSSKQMQTLLRGLFPGTAERMWA
jgi:5-methylcytosine-specific restriction endonuclease McrA